ncbi:hypothetical protein HFO58_31925 [Rhizobium leguminosarum]|uniref:hypothetical protein n=1 Tax=Rhizobium leguminosarum TaxID=384 RepID=UPI001C93A642|nr:hypothetical protein [Rhizobium leguminosarum]MBY5537702.1 hypothetical protein [Rhizobium leguminosarum]
MRPEHLTNTYLTRLRYGDSVDLTIPPSPTYGMPTAPIEYLEPLPFQGKREPSTKSPFNYRGAMVGINDNRIMPFESKVERNAELMFQTDHRVLLIKPQPVSLKYTAADGTEKRHIIDFLLHEKGGGRRLVAAKPTLLLFKTGLIDLLLRLWDQGRFRGIADHISFVTEKYASDEAAYNAVEIIKARRLFNEMEYWIARDLLKNIRGEVRFRALLAGAEPPGLRRIALWNLIDEKRLQPVKAGRIEDNSLMTVSL